MCFDGEVIYHVNYLVIRFLCSNLASFDLFCVGNYGRFAPANYLVVMSILVFLTRDALPKQFFDVRTN